MPASITTRRQRRQMVLRALRGESMAALGREYGLDRRTVQMHVSRAVAEAEERREEAREELEYRREVEGLIS